MELAGAHLGSILLLELPPSARSAIRRVQPLLWRVQGGQKHHALLVRRWSRRQLGAELWRPGAELEAAGRPGVPHGQLQEAIAILDGLCKAFLPVWGVESLVHVALDPEGLLFLHEHLRPRFEGHAADLAAVLHAKVSRKRIQQLPRGTRA